MKISLNWIKKYTKITLSNEDLIAKIFTQIGAVEHVEDLSKKYKDVLVSQIVKAQEHPEADKLGIYTIDIGDKTVQVVAGDKTLQVGDMVAYFPVDSVVPAYFGNSNEGIVKSIKLRGVLSEGMLASQKELDLGGDHEKVMRIELECKAGDSFAKVFELDDIVIDIENKALANRGDCFGIIGVAREIAAIQGLKFKSPDFYANPSTLENIHDTLPLDIVNQAGGNCPRYMAIAMDNVQIKDSPQWLKNLLLVSGVRPINNIVDITNYLMILTAQPLHAFDYDKIVAKDTKSKNVARIVVRQAEAGEAINTLDGKSVELSDGVTVIADSSSPIAVAGIIGGADTEIDENTKRIVIECANFDRYNVRRSSMKLGVFTDAVTRFTKAQDPNRCENVIVEAVRMVQELAEGNIASPVKDDYQIVADKKILNVQISKLNTHLGTKLNSSEVKKILENIEYKCEVVDENTLKVSVPTFRQDISIVQDIYEDVGRLYGYNNIEVTLPRRSIKPASQNPRLQFKRKLRDILSSNGLNEILTYNFVGKQLLESCNLSIEDAHHITNALSPELEYMRYSLLQSVHEKTVLNIQNGYTDFGLFEINIGHSTTEFDEQKLPLERELLTISTATKSSSYFQVKAYLDLLCEKLGVENIEYELLTDVDTTTAPAWIQRVQNFFEVNRSALVYVKSGNERRYLGVVGEYVQNPISGLNLGYMELDIRQLQSHADTLSRYIEPSKYPEVVQDLCFLLDDKVQYIQVKREIKRALDDQSLSTSVSLLDVYASETMDGNKQMTVTVKMKDMNKTLTPKTIQDLREKIVSKVSKKFKAKLV